MNSITDHRSHVVALIQAELDARRIAISRELATIPPPVPACDVDFNRLLEDRGQIADAAYRLKQMLAGNESDEAVLGFCRESTFLSDATKQEIDLLLRSASQHLS